MSIPGVSSRWKFEQMLQAVWVGAVQWGIPEGEVGQPRVLINGRDFTDDEIGTIETLMENGQVRITDEAITLTTTGEELARHWARYIPLPDRQRDADQDLELEL